MAKQKIVILIIVLFFLASKAGLAQSYNGYRLNIDDQIYVSVWGHSDLQREVLIGPDGTISFPLIGELNALGLTLEELKEVLTEKLSIYIRGPQLEISLSKYQGLKILVLGEVVRPGTYQLNFQGRVLDAISQAGGPTLEADLENINLTRVDEALAVNLVPVLRGVSQDSNFILQSGDVIFIPRSTMDVTILGEVRSQGTYQLKKDSTLSDLVARAGGFLDDAGSEILLKRGDDLRSIKTREIVSENRLANPLLVAGDSVYVPKVVQKVAIMGEVAKPGTYNWYEGLRMVDLLAQAGNITNKANREIIKKISFDGTINSVYVDDYLNSGKIAGNPFLEPGDIILVGESKNIDWETIFFFVRGFSAVKDLLK